MIIDDNILTNKTNNIMKVINKIDCKIEEIQKKILEINQIYILNMNLIKILN